MVVSRLSGENPVSESPMRFQPRRALLAAVLSSLGLWLFLGCRSQDPLLDEQEKAKRVQVLRRRADEALARFVASNDDPKGADLESLMEYAELEGETTKLLPSTCPSCYQRHAVALLRVGRYYETLALAYDQEASRASASEKRKFQAKAEDARKQALEYFANSRRQFENYLLTSRNNSQWVDPDAYRVLFQICEQLKDYQRALRYLDLYTANVVLTDQDKRNAEELRQAYLREIQKQEEERLRGILKGESG